MKLNIKKKQLKTLSNDKTSLPRAATRQIAGGQVIATGNDLIVNPSDVATIATTETTTTIDTSIPTDLTPVSPWINPGSGSFNL